MYKDSTRRLRFCAMLKSLRTTADSEVHTMVFLFGGAERGASSAMRYPRRHERRFAAKRE